MSALEVWSLIDLQGALDDRKLRMRAFRSGDTWLVLLNGEHFGASFAGRSVSLVEAVGIALRDADQKLRARA